jgi:hypothetical protein
VLFLFCAEEDLKAGARDPHNNAGGEAGSRNFVRDGEQNICDQMSSPR